MTARRYALVLATTLAGATVLSAPAPAFAKGDDGVRASKKCGTGVIKLKAKHDDGRIEVEAEVDTNRNGQVWLVRMSDNGTSVFRGRRTTHAPSGSFEVERHIANRAGTDVITVSAKRGSRTCWTRVSL